MPAVPIIPKVVTFTLEVPAGDPEDFSLDAVDLAIVPAPGAVQTVRTLDGVKHQDAESETWALEVTAIQDWDTTRPGLAAYLMTNKGATATFVVQLYDAAISTTTPAMTGTCTLVAMAMGGPGNTFVTSTVSMPIDGDPVVDTAP